MSCLRNATWYYRSQARDNSVLRQRLRELATARPRFGYQRLHILLTREGWLVGRKRVHRLYKLEGLQVRMRVRRRKRISLQRGPAVGSIGLWILSMTSYRTAGSFAC